MEPRCPHRVDRSQERNDPGHLDRLSRPAEWHPEHLDRLIGAASALGAS